MELDDMWMLHSLQHLHLVVHHLLVALDILLQDNLHGHLARGPICLADDSICPGTEGPSKAVLGSARWSATSRAVGVGGGGWHACLLLVVAFGLAVQLVKHIRDWMVGTQRHD